MFDNEQVTFKNYAPIFDYISEINSTQVDNKKDLDVVQPMCNLIEYIDNYSRTSGILDMYQMMTYQIQNHLNLNKNHK